MAIGAKVQYKRKTGKSFHTFLMIASSTSALATAARKEIEHRKGDPNTMEYIRMWNCALLPQPARLKK